MLKRFATSLKRAMPLAVGIAMAGVMLSSPAMALTTNASGAGFAGGLEPFVLRSRPYSGDDHGRLMGLAARPARLLGAPAHLSRRNGDRCHPWHRGRAAAMG